MANITLKNDGSAVMLEIDIRTPQDFNFTVMVVDDTMKQYLHFTGSSDGPTSFPVGTTDFLIGKYLNIYWTVIDRAGAGNPYSASASAVQNGIKVANPQVCSGTSGTSASNVVTAGQFISA